MKKIFAVIAVALIAAAMASVAKADPRISATAVVNSDRTVTFTWNVPSSLQWGGAVIVNPTSQTDGTGALPFDGFGEDTLAYKLTGYGTTSVQTIYPLDMNITQPTTVYGQVQLIDPFGDGSCTQGDFFTECDSQVIPITVQPICTQVVVTPGYYKTVVVTAAYYSKKLVARAHYLIRHGHKVKWTRKYHRPKYSKKHGWVWVNAVYKQVYHPEVDKQVWVPPVYSTQCQ